MEDTQETAEQLFVTVLGLEPSERSAYLSKVCHDSPSLRERVEQCSRRTTLPEVF